MVLEAHPETHVLALDLLAVPPSFDTRRRAHLGTHRRRLSPSWILGRGLPNGVVSGCSLTVRRETSPRENQRVDRHSEESHRRLEAVDFPALHVIGSAGLAQIRSSASRCTLLCTAGRLFLAWGDQILLALRENETATLLVWPRINANFRAC